MKTKILFLFALLLFTPAPALAQNVPPSTFYGWVTPGGDFAPTVGMSVTGTVAGQVCGATEVFVLEGQLAYALQVNSHEDQAGCGVLGATVVFHVGEWEMAHDAAWDNRQANFWPLSVVRQPPPTETPTPKPTNTPIVITLTPTRTPTPTPPPTTPAPTETPTPSTMPSATPEPTEPAPPPTWWVYLALVDR